MSVESIVDSLRDYYAASNEAARLRDLALRLTRGTGSVTLEGIGASGAFSTAVPRVPLSTLSFGSAFTHDLPGPTFRLLSDSVASPQLSYVQAASRARRRRTHHGVTKVLCPWTSITQNVYGRSLFQGPPPERPNDAKTDAHGDRPVGGSDPGELSGRR